MTAAWAGVARASVRRGRGVVKSSRSHATKKRGTADAGSGVAGKSGGTPGANLKLPSSAAGAKHGGTRASVVSG
eukprot:15474711-Alexandrium_andersonii.AAC.1